MMTYLIDLLNECGDGFCGFALMMLIQSSVLIGLLYGIDLVIRRRVRAVFRYGMWMLVLVKLMLPPGLCMPTGVGYWCGIALPEAKETVVWQPLAEPIEIQIPQIALKQELGSPLSAPKQRTSIEKEQVSVETVQAEAQAVGSGQELAKDAGVCLRWQGGVFLLWLVGMLVLSVLLFQRFLFVRSLLAQSEPANERLEEVLQHARRELGIKKEVQLRLAGTMMSPAACGLWRPVILIPAALLGKLSRDKLYAVLVHELAHIKRGDLWVHLGQTLLQIVYFYHPLLWLANAKIRRVREKAVDEMVLTALGDQADGYSRTLIDIAEAAFSRPHFSLRLVGVVESKKALKSRIQHILSRPFPKSAKLGIAGLLAIGIAAAALLPMAKAEFNPPEFIIKGTVTDAKTGEPISGAKVGDSKKYNEGKFYGITDSNGDYEYKTWYEEHDVNAEADDYQRQDKGFGTKLFGSEKKKVIDFALEKCLDEEAEHPSNKDMANAVSGIVTDTLGRSRSQVTISSSGTNIWGKVYTDAQGRFTIEAIEPGQNVWLAYSQHSKAMGFFSIPQDYKGQALHVVLNYQEGEISGRVVDGNGAGLAKKKVEFIFKTEGGLTYTIPAYSETNQYGIYKSSGIPCGAGLSVQTRVIPVDENEEEAITKPVQLTANQISVEMPLLVIGDGQYKESDDGQVRYSGRIVNEQNEPVSGVKVKLSYNMPNQMGLSERLAMTDSQGRWSAQLPNDHSNLYIRLSHPEYISFHYDQSLRTPPKAELLDGSNAMIMKKGLRISGTVLGPDGKSIENALVAAGRLYSSSDGRIIEDCTTDRTRVDGSFSIGGLPEEQVDVGVSAGGYAPVIVSVDVGKDTEPVKVTLKKGKVYRGQIVDQDDQPLEGIKVRCDEWNVEGKRRYFSVLTETDREGLFSVSDVPDTGTLTFGFGKSRSGLESFSKPMPEDLSAIDKMVMYPVPAITAKVIDAESKEPIKDFTIIQGCKWKATDEEPGWSRYYKNQIHSEEGSFEKKWGGYHITYPFDGAAFMKVEAEGYYSESTPPVELGKQYEPFVIELTRCKPVTGIIIDSDARPAGGAEVGWVGPGKKAFIKDGQFDRTGFSNQTETIISADEDGRFSLNPERGDALIVVMHERGYAQINSADFQEGSEIKLIPWAKIEVTLDASEPEKNTEISITTPTQVDNTDPTPHISWMVDRLSTTKDSLTLEHIPAEPLYIAKALRFEQNNATYLEPEPGKTHRIRLGQKGSTVTGTIALADSSPHDFADPRQTHVVAFKVNGGSELAEKIKSLQCSSFKWLFQDPRNVYPASKTYQSRFIPQIDPQGNVTLKNIPPGEYELVINLHDLPGKNVSCGRGVLKSAAVVGFSVEKGQGMTQLPRIELKTLIHPGLGQTAPLFEANTFDGKTVRLSDYRGKMVLLEFWASWCAPCVREMPKMKTLYETYQGNQHFVMLGMNLDWDSKQAEKYITTETLGWEQLALGNMAESEIVSQYGIGGIPTCILIGPDGEILAKDLDAIEKILQSLGKNETETGKTVSPTPASPAEGNFTAALPNGVTVELVGVCEHPSGGKGWWRADGSELKQRPWEKINGSVSSVSGLKEYEFALKLNYPEDKAPGYYVMIGERGGRCSGGHQQSSTSELRWELVGLPENLETTDVHLAIASGPWEIQQKQKPFPGGVYCSSGVVWHAPIAQEDRTILSVAHGFTKDQSRLVAIDKQGNEHIGGGNSGSINGDTLNAMVTFKVKLEEIEEFQIRTRPYEYRTFRNVSLKPGVRTDVEVIFEDAKTDADTDVAGQQSTDPALSEKQKQVQALDKLFGSLKAAYEEKDWGTVNTLAEGIRDVFRHNKESFIELFGQDQTELLEELSDELHDSVRDEKLYLAPAYYDQLIIAWEKSSTDDNSNNVEDMKSTIQVGKGTEANETKEPKWLKIVVYKGSQEPDVSLKLPLGTGLPMIAPMIPKEALQLLDDPDKLSSEYFPTPTTLLDVKEGNERVIISVE